MCSKPRKCKNNMLNFKNMNGLLKHIKKYKCYHHINVHRYLTYYLRLKEKQSFLSNQLKDVAKHNTKCYYSKKKIYLQINHVKNVTTYNMNNLLNISLQSNHVKNVITYNMKYLLNKSLHHNEILRHITSMCTVSETK